MFHFSADVSKAARVDAVSQAVAAAKRGDRQALGYLYVRYADDVCRFLDSIVHDRDDAEDLTQSVFAKLVTAIGRYEERGEVPFVGWLMRVARNAALDHLRVQRLVPVEEVHAPEHPEPGEPACRRVLLDALEEIPEGQREVLVLRHLCGLSPPEIASRASLSEGAVHGLHHRGRAALKHKLAERGAKPATRDYGRHCAAAAA
jgi:RNA polymerase sigma-70 factor, ECF subfamily